MLGPKAASLDKLVSSVPLIVGFVPCCAATSGEEPIVKENQAGCSVCGTRLVFVTWNRKMVLEPKTRQRGCRLRETRPVCGAASVRAAREPGKSGTRDRAARSGDAGTCSRLGDRTAVRPCRGRLEAAARARGGEASSGGPRVGR